MKINLVAYGIAKEILGGSEIQLETPEGSSLQELKQVLIKKYPDFEKLKSLRFAVNEDYQDDDFLVSERDVVVIIPPVSGG
jgi:molybdopterin converting factor subunit 1